MTFHERIQKTIKHYSRYNRNYFRNKFYDNAFRKFVEEKLTFALCVKIIPD